MNIRDLTYIIAVADQQHFGKAAEACFVSQPTLSAQIKKVEDELGLQIFERGHKGILITHKGAALILQVRKILREITDLKKMAAQLHDPLAGDLTLGLIPTLAPYLLPYIIPRFRESLPHLRIMLAELQTEVLLKKLRHGEVDAIILAEPVDTEGLNQIHLFNERFFAALSPEHPLAKQKQIQLLQLKEEPLLLLTEGHCLRDQALAACHDRQFKPSHEVEATSLETLRHMASAGLGVTLLPELATLSPNIDPAQLAILKLSEPTPERSMVLLYRQQSPQQICFEKIAELVQAAIKPILSYRPRKS